MKKKTATAALAAVTIMAACTTPMTVTKTERSRILVDSTYDRHTDSRAEAFMQPYRQQVDSIMSPVVGKAACYMAAERPESKLSNLLADVLIWAAERYGEKPDFSVYNMGGMRAAFAQGDVTTGDVLDVAPFENKICFLSLDGEEVMELFSQIASVGGEGVSHGVELTVDSNRKLLTARLNGKQPEAGKTYRIATLDYLAQGNDKMEAFKKKKDVVMPEEERNNVRYLIMDYFKEKAAQGKAVTAEVEGRITVRK